MAQQLNLYSPIHAAPRQPFSARTMSLSLLVLVAALGLLGTWMVAGGAALRHEMQASARLQAAEREQLSQALASRRSTGGAALEQERMQLESRLLARRALVDELARGRIVEGRSHAAVLRMVALTVPEAVWLDQIRLREGSLELAGMTLQPQALRPWLARLAGHPLTQGQRLGMVKLERVATAPSEAGTTGPELWAFALSSSQHAPEAAPGDAAAATASVTTAGAMVTPGVAR